jgi:NAD(P)H-hydrate epimerase
MPQSPISRDEARELDRRAIEDLGVPSIVLMENAGRGTAELLLRLGIHGRVIVCCGKGNNGGDGLVIARHLNLHGIPVKVLLFGRPEELSTDAAVNYRILERAGFPMQTIPDQDVNETALRHELAGAEWAVDALFGTGLRGAVRPPFDRVIATINDSAVRVLAVDIPSGLDCDTGLPMGATIRARHTATFMALKKGYTNPAARPWLGQVHVVHIGAPLESAACGLTIKSPAPTAAG